MFMNLPFSLLIACSVWQECFYWKPCYVFLELLLLGTSSITHRLHLPGIYLPLFCLLTQYFIHLLLYTLFLTHFALLTAWIPVFLLMANICEKQSFQQIHLSLSLTTKSLFIIFSYLSLMNCCLCRKEVANSSRLWDWKDPSFLALRSLARGTLTPRSFSSPSPMDMAAAGSQPLSSPFSSFSQAPSSALTPAFLHCNCQPSKHPAPNYFFSISSSLAVSAPKFGISDIVTKVIMALPSATDRLPRPCWPCKITPSKGSPSLPSYYLWSLIVSHVTPLCNTAIPHSTVCTFCTTSLCYVLCPVFFHVMPSHFPGSAHLAKPQARAKSPACIP